jgi:hypothetical protein
LERVGSWHSRCPVVGVAQVLTKSVESSSARGTLTPCILDEDPEQLDALSALIDKVRLSDGEKALIKATKDAQGGGHTGAMVGAMAATAIFTLGGSALFLLMHGKDITIPKGTAVTAFIQGDDVLDRSKFEKYARAN